MNLLKITLGFSAFVAANAFAAMAITPSYDTFGTLSGATFGGTGIPNNAVAQVSNANLVLGLTATSRFDTMLNPVTNNGAGSFTALAGADSHAPSSPADPYGRWNFNYFVGPGANPTANPSATFSYRIFYDFDPAANNLDSTHGVIAFPHSSFLLASTAIGYVANQGSLNLGFDNLSVTVPAGPYGIYAPSPSFTFDPNALGQYTFRLAAYSISGSNPFATEVLSTSILVNVVPEPAEWAMMLTGLLAVAALARRRKRV